MSATVATIERVADGRMRVAGELGYAHAAEALASGLRLHQQGGAGSVEVDLSGLREVDSATLAILLAWAARSAHAGVPLRFTGAPASLLALAQLCDAGPLLGIEA